MQQEIQSVPSASDVVVLPTDSVPDLVSVLLSDHSLVQAWIELHGEGGCGPGSNLPRFDVDPDRHLDPESLSGFRDQVMVRAEKTESFSRVEHGADLQSSGSLWWKPWRQSGIRGLGWRTPGLIKGQDR